MIEIGSTINITGSAGPMTLLKNCTSLVPSPPRFLKGGAFVKIFPMGSFGGGGSESSAARRYGIMIVPDIRKGARNQVLRIVASRASASDLMRMARSELKQASLFQGHGDLRAALRLSALYRCTALVLAFTDSLKGERGRKQQALLNDYIVFSKACCLFSKSATVIS